MERFLWLLFGVSASCVVLGVYQFWRDRPIRTYLRKR
jgi:hypothetical protein